MALPVIHSDEPLRHVDSKFQSVHVTLIFDLSARKWCCQLHMQLKAFPPNLVYTIFRSEIMDLNRQTAAISNTTRGNLEFFRDQKSAISSEQEGLRTSRLVSGAWWPASPMFRCPPTWKLSFVLFAWGLTAFSAQIGYIVP